MKSWHRWNETVARQVAAVKATEKEMNQTQLLHALVADRLKWLDGPAALAAAVGGKAVQTWEGVVLRNVPTVLIKAFENAGWETSALNDDTYLVAPPR